MEKVYLASYWYFLLKIILLTLIGYGALISLYAQGVG
jgi:hypothetical protein